MAKTVLVECYEADGGSYSFRQSVSDWEKTAPMLESMLGDELAATQFYVVYRDLKRRWDGARKMTLHATLCRPEFEVQWMESGKGCHCSVFPVLVPKE